VLTIFVSTLTFYVGALSATKVMHKYLLRNILRATTEFFDTTPIGRILNRFSKDIDAADNDLPAVFRAWIMCFLSVHT
jgi:ATP-binding cassette subfamily C (CFTR/MRP) protein 1